MKPREGDLIRTLGQIEDGDKPFFPAASDASLRLEFPIYTPRDKQKPEVTQQACRGVLLFETRKIMK